MIKFLISGLPNIGKSTLIKDLDPEETLLISRDGKKSPLHLPKKTIEDFTNAQDLVNQIIAAIKAYKEAKGKNPKTIIIDSISKIFLDIEAKILRRITSFPYGVINTEITLFMGFLEHSLASQCNLGMISHAEFDKDLNSYSLVNAGGAWGKKGGAISEVENALFIEMKGNKRIIHHKTYKFLSRTLSVAIPDTQPVEDFNLQTYINTLAEEALVGDTYEL